MSRRPELVVFDCDGTLVDSQGAIVATVQRAFAGEGLRVPTDAEVRDRVGLSLDAFVADLVGDLPPARVESLVRRYREEFVSERDARGADPLFPGLRELLDDLLRRGVLLGVATGKSRRGLNSVLDAHGLRPHFVTTQSADDAPSKPHPAMVLQAIDEAGVTPHATVMIGDSVYDMQAARAAGRRRDRRGVGLASGGAAAGRGRPPRGPEHVRTRRRLGSLKSTLRLRHFLLQPFAGGDGPRPQTHPPEERAFPLDVPFPLLRVRPSCSAASGLEPLCSP